jgi:hypothetical protein
MRTLTANSNPRLGRAALAAVLGVCLAAPASAQYTIGWYTVDGGGTSAASGGVYGLAGTIGQFDPGVLSGGVYTLRGGFWRGGAPVVDVEEDEGPVATTPLAFRLHGATPNPVMRSSVVAFDLPAPRSVRMRVYDTSGRVARTLLEGKLAAGRHQSAWPGDDDRGLPLAAGVYFIHLETGTERATRKVTVLR